MRFGRLMQNNMPIIVAEIETGSRIQKWQTFVFKTGSS